MVVLMPPVMEAAKAEPMARPSQKLWIPSPRITIQATAATSFGIPALWECEWLWERLSFRDLVNLESFRSSLFLSSIFFIRTSSSCFSLFASSAKSSNALKWRKSVYQMHSNKSYAIVSLYFVNFVKPAVNNFIHWFLFISPLKNPVVNKMPIRSTLIF